MGLFDKLKCRKRCRAKLATQPQLVAGCEAYCAGNPNAQPEDYLCAMSPELAIQTLGIDPCQSDNVTANTIYNNSLAAIAQENENILSESFGLNMEKGVFVAGILLVILLIVLFVK